MRALIVIAVVAACSKSNDHCAADVADLTAFIASLDLDSAPAPWGVHLVVRDGLPVQPMQPMAAVVMTPGRLQINGQLATNADLVERLRDAQKHPEGQRGLLLVIDEAMPWSEVVAVTDAARTAGMDRIGLPFAYPPHVSRPQHTALDDAVANLTGSEQQIELAHQIKAVVASCPALIRELGRVGLEEGTNKMQTLAKRTPDAVRACDCKVDLAQLKSSLWFIFDQDHPARFMFVTLSAEAAPLALPGTTSWGEASKRIAPGATIRPVVQ